MTETREETVETIEAVETAKAGKNGEESKGENPNLVRVPWIRYPITFRKKSVSMSALLNSSSEVNAIYPTLVRELGLPIKPTDIGAQKIDGTILDIFEIVITAFSVTDKANQVRFFEETFLVANVGPEVVLGMSLFILSDTDVDFSGWELWWRTYTTKKALPTIKCIKLMGKKEFAATALDPERETFVIYVASLNFNVLPSSSSLELDVYPFRRPQISGLIAEEALMKVPVEYSDFADVFTPDLVSKLSEYSGINNYVIKLIDSQQPPYRLIYSLEPVELETLKAYIETNLTNEFITLSNSPAGAPILFDRKSDGSFQLYVDYQSLNNLTIENQYPLPLTGELLDWLERAKQLIQLNFTSAYHWMRIREGDK